MAEKMIRKKRHFLVKFKDYGPQYMMWLPASKITARRLISLFWQKKKNAPNEQPTLAAYMSSTSAWPVCHDLHSRTIEDVFVRVKTSTTTSITARIRSSSAHSTFVAASFSDDFHSANAIVDNRRLIDRASEQRWSGSIDRADLYIDPTDLAKLGLGGSGITPTKDKE